MPHVSNAIEDSPNGTGQDRRSEEEEKGQRCFLPRPIITELCPVIVVAVHAQQASNHLGRLPRTIAQEPLRGYVLREAESSQRRSCHISESSHDLSGTVLWSMKFEVIFVDCGLLMSFVAV